MLRRSLSTVLLLCAVLGLALATGQRLFFSVAYLLGALLLLAFLLTWVNLLWVKVERRTRTHRSQVGKPLEEELVVFNTAWLPKLWLELRDHSTLPGYHAGRVISSLPARQTRIWNVRSICRQRGRFTLGPITLISGDPFGLFVMRRRIAETRPIIIYPATVDLPEFPIPFGELPGGEALRRRTHHVTDNVAGVRDYMHGDSFNRIHWPSTARTARLISKEFELDPTTDIWVYLDMDEGVHVAAPWLRAAEDSSSWSEPLWAERARELELIPTTEEYTVTIGASLLRRLLAQGRAVGMVAYGQSREVVQPDRGERQLSRLLETLAVLSARGSLPFSQILSAEGESLRRGTTILAVTPSTDLDWVHAARNLGRRGVQVVAVMVQPDTFSVAPDQTPALSELQASQISTFVVHRGDRLDTALARPTMGGLMDAHALRRA